MIDRLRAGWKWTLHGPPMPPIHEYRISDEEMKRRYPNLRRLGVTPNTDVFAAMEILAAKLLESGHE